MDPVTSLPTSSRPPRLKSRGSALTNIPSCFFMIILFVQYIFSLHGYLITFQRKLDVLHVLTCSECFSRRMSWPASSSAVPILLTLIHFARGLLFVLNLFAFVQLDFFFKKKGRQQTMLGITLGVYIDIVMRTWHPAHSATAQRNYFVCLRLARSRSSRKYRGVYQSTGGRRSRAGEQ